MKALILKGGHEPRFVKYLIQGRQHALLAAWRKTGATVESIEHELLANTLFPVPPLDEQRAIADYLDEKTAAIDALIAKRERHIELLEERHLATVSTEVTSGLDSVVPMQQTGTPWLGKVPAHWAVADLKRVLQSADYGISDSLDGEGEVPVLRMGNIRRGEVVMDDLKFVADVSDPMLLRPMDLLFNRTNSLDLVGRVGIFRGSDFDRITFASYLVRFRTTPEMDPQYLCYLLNTPAVLAVARAMALPAIGQANLSPSRYGYLRICIPPIEEQRAIVEVVARRQAAVRASQSMIQHQIEKLREYRQTLHSAAVTGQIPVREEIPA
jgi:type I restriction enzyme S subunit